MRTTLDIEDDVLAAAKEPRRVRLFRGCSAWRYRVMGIGGMLDHCWLRDSAPSGPPIQNWLQTSRSPVA